MATQTANFDNLTGFSFDYDDVSGDVLSITIDATNAGITKIPSGIALNADRAEKVLSALFDELAEQLKETQTNLDCPVWMDAANSIFDSQGIVDRDSGTVDGSGNPITETQLFKRVSLIQYYKFDSASVMSPANAVNNDD